MKIVHSAFHQPPTSWRRKRSVRTMITVQIQATQTKKMIIDQRMFRNG